MKYMAGWSILDDGFIVGIVKIPQKNKLHGLSVDLESVPEGLGVQVEEELGSSVVEGLSDKVQCWFDQLLREFLKKNCARYSIRPIPSMLGNGQPVDLYKLFMVVKEKGGCDAVSKNRLWDLVGEQSGLGMSIGSSVKLIYSKYLSTLEIWLKKVADSKVSDGSLEFNRVDFGRHLMEFHAEVEGLLSDYTEEMGDEMCQSCDFNNEFKYPEGGKLCDNKGVKSPTAESGGAKKIQNRGFIDLNMPDPEMNEPSLGNVCIKKKVNRMPRLSDGGKRCDNDNVLVLDSSSVNRDIFDRKRKRESVWVMLSWVTGIAKNPCDPVVGSIPERSKWRSHSNEEIWKQVLLFREAVFLKRHVESSSEELNWLNQRMHPCMYDDHLGATYNLRERLKCDKRLLFGKSASAVRVSSDSSLGTQSDLERTPSPHTKDSAEKQLLDSSTGPSGLDKCDTMHIPLGPNHQAVVPEWTGMTSESDPKWLGIQIWPSDKVNRRLLIERDPIGKGRQDSCGCQVPGSVECVRFHVAERRAKVKLELGVAFNLWNLDKVGEEVRQLWTVEEEKKFKDVVRSNPPSLEKYYWDHIFKSFPKKTREDLVSYYFNVFLLQRRGYQNRHTPNDIDSDDEESEFGPLRNVFGQQAQNSTSSILLTPKKPKTKNR